MKLAFLFLALFVSVASRAATPSVQQSGVVTPGHPTSWTTTGVVQDGGTPASPQLTGVGVASNNQGSICTQNSKTGFVSQICLGSPSTGGFLTYSSTGLLPLKFVINGVTYTWPFPSNPINVPFLAATSFGVKADGVTSDDVAMNNALTACTNAGAALWLPPGKILLTGAQQLSLSNCNMIGSGFLSGSQTGGGPGTTFLLTSTSLTPFIIGNYWSVSGVNFYWPNQTNGTTVYPPLMTDNGSGTGGTQWSLDHVGVINAYDGIAQTASGGWGGIFITNSFMYAINDMFRLGNAGGIVMTNNGFSAGLWLQTCNNACQAAVDAGTTGNSIFHIVNKSGAVNLGFSNSSVFNWRYFFRLDAGGVVGLSDVVADIDGIGTMIDASPSGANWSGLNSLSGSGDCGTWLFVSAAPRPGVSHPCFNMGATSGLSLRGWSGGFSTGDYIDTTGSNIVINNVQVSTVGTVADSGTYYGIHATANPGGLQIRVNNSEFGGAGVTANGYGIVSTVAPAVFSIQNSTFGSFQQNIVTPYATGSTTVAGNVSDGTTAGTVSVAFSGSGSAIWGNNHFDKNPQPTVSNCGTGAHVTGGIAGGTIFVGSTVPTESCQLNLPFSPYGGASSNGSCVFNGTVATTTAAAASGNPPVWTVVTMTDVSNTELTYRCGSE